MLHPQLVQHIESKEHPQTALTFDQFIDLLRQEEIYFQGDEYKTKLQLSRLRKIFYDKYGWDTQLIRGVAHIEGRYLVKLVPATEGNYSRKHSKFHAGGTDYQRREVLVREHDWLNPNVGTTPEIYNDNHQQIVLPSGLVCDIGHVLAGMDAENYPMPVAPLPTKLMFLHCLVPHVDSNADAATWIGDLSSVTGDILFHYLQTNAWPDQEKTQQILDEGNPAADMLGNIDSLCVGQLYDLDTEHGMLITDILQEYYAQLQTDPTLRYRLFCKAVGLHVGADGQLVNKAKWIRRYARELKATTAFYIASRYSKPAAYWYALIVWLGFFRKHLLYRTLLENLLTAITPKL